MGCHTWFRVPYITDKAKIIELAKQQLQHWIDKKYIHPSEVQMNQYAIDNELIVPICSLAEDAVEGSQYDSEAWIIYKDVRDYALIKYNEANGTNFKDVYQQGFQAKASLESYSDEPRISGYPPNIIRSYEEMTKFMETGFDDEEGKHHSFAPLEPEREERIMNGIKQFFVNHPQGIITFG